MKKIFTLIFLFLLLAVSANAQIDETWFGVPDKDAPVASTRDYYYVAKHNRVNTCKNLLAYYTLDELSAMIASGTFDDIYVGDYIEMEMTSDYGTETVRWIVADINYFKTKTDVNLSTNHIVLVAEDGFETQHKLNSSNTTVGGYASSAMYITVLPKYDTAIENAFGASHVLSYHQMLTTSVDANTPSMAGTGMTGCSNGWAWATGATNYPHITKLNLMSEPQVLGTIVNSSSFYDIGINCSQFSLFAQLSEKIICGRGLNHSTGLRSSYWLSAIVSSTFVANINYMGMASNGGTSVSNSIRPYFLFK